MDNNIAGKITSGRHLLSCAVATLALSGCAGSGEETTAETNSNGTIVINEIVAKDANGGHDWIELYVTEGTVNLAEYTLVDDNEDHEPQSLPDVTLSAGQYIVIEAIDEEDTASEGSDFVTFKLGSSDALTLAFNGTMVSTLSWEDGQAEEGYSFGLLPDGTGSAITLIPTKGAQNSDSGEVVAVDQVVDSFPALVINEVVAKAADGGSDWIEFYVSGTSSVNLGDYSVKDEGASTALSLPDVTLAPGEYYTVYATDETLAFAESVAIKLGASDSVSLFKGDDLIDSITWDKGEALIGYSFGRYQDGEGARQTLTPTMNASNVPGIRGPLIINEVMVADAKGGSDWFELYNHGSEAIALNQYHVIDESDDLEPVALPDVTLNPGEHVVIYATNEETSELAVPFKLGSHDSLSLIFNDETVDYLAWDETDAPEGYSYGAYPDGAWTYKTLAITPNETNVVAVVFDTSMVDSLYIDIAEEEWSDLVANAQAEEYHPATITYKGVTLENVAIRTKGNSSLSGVVNSGSQRFSFKVDMNEYEEGQKLLNLKKINLNNNYKDPTYMRETISYDLMREMDIPAPRTAYVRLYINNALHGLYTLVEPIDGEFLENHFTNADGDLYKPDATGVQNAVGNDLKWVDDLFDTYTAIALKTNEETSDNQALIHFLDELNNGSDYASVMNVDGILRYLAVSTAMSNLDSYQGALAHNYYIYENSNRFSVIPWDFNQSFASFSMGCSAEEMISLYIDEPTSGALADRPLIAKLFENADYLETYHAYLAELVAGGMDPDVLTQTINETAALIRDAVYEDPTAFYTPEQFETSLTDSIEDVPGLISFATARVENIRNQLDGTVAASGDGSGSCTSGTGSFPGPGGGELPSGPPPF